MISPAPAETRIQAGAAAPSVAQADLAARLASRICHDLVSPLGAVGNGLELLAMGGGSQTAEMALITDSMAATHLRIQLFRLAFGLAGAEQRLAAAELGKLLHDHGKTLRLQIRFEAEGDLARGDAKLITLALLCLGTALPWGGQVLICRAETRGQDGAASGWRLIAEAERTRPDRAIWSWLDIAPDAAADKAGPARVLPAPGEVHFPLFGLESMTQGRRITWDLDEQGAEIAF